MKDTPETPEEVIFRCWQKGYSIGSTLKAVKVRAGVKVDFETVRIKWVELSEKFF